MMIGAHAEGALKERLLQALEEQTQQLYRRPYLRRGIAERTLIILNALFEAKPSPRHVPFEMLAGRHITRSSVRRATGRATCDSLACAGCGGVNRRHRLGALAVSSTGAPG